ncbi:lipoprotein [Neisseriaceae bacterium CLB008]|nr:hypothetical protein [Neisseriaceae bacterium]
MRLITIGALSALILSACGYQGPLYLPDPTAPKQSTAPATPLVPATPAAAADDSAERAVASPTSQP